MCCDEKMLVKMVILRHWLLYVNFRALTTLYAELRSENERLREALTETTLQLAQLKVDLERATQVKSRGPGGQGVGEGAGAGSGSPGGRTSRSAQG